MSTFAARIEVSRNDGWFTTAQKMIAKVALVCGAVFKEMSLLDHLEELRHRILLSLIAVVVAFSGCFYFAVPLIQIAKYPSQMAGVSLVIIEATEVFSLYFKVALTAGLCISAPFVLFQVWQFIAPGLYDHEKRYATPFLLSTTLCFVGGAVFGYLFMLPMALRIAVQMAADAAVPIQMSMSSYFDLMTTLVLCTGVMFEIPPVVFILSRIGLIDARFLARNLQYAVLLSVIAAAVLTPTQDGTTMILVTIPIVGLYLVGILVALVFGKKRVPV